MNPIPISQALPAPGAFWTFNREERDAVAVLFGLLVRPGNLDAFARLLDWHPVDLADAEVSVEWKRDELVAAPAQRFGLLTTS